MGHYALPWVLFGQSLAWPTLVACAESENTDAIPAQRIQSAARFVDAPPESGIKHLEVFFAPVQCNGMQPGVHLLRQDRPITQIDTKGTMWPNS